MKQRTDNQEVPYSYLVDNIKVGGRLQKRNGGF